MLDGHINPASSEQLDYMWQREAAVSALRGIQQVAARGGLHRREESFMEIARDEVSVRARRLFGRIASLGSGLREWGRGIRENFILAPDDSEPGSLADLGFAGVPHVERRLSRPNEWATLNTQVPDTPAAVTRSFSAAELADLQRIVRQRRADDGVSGIYETQNK